MRLFVLVLFVAWPFTGLRADDAPRPPSADESVLFHDAIRKSAQDTEHWAYTETSSLQASRGEPKGETIMRFDPSKPYAEQFMPVLIDGKPPTEKQLADYRQRGERRGEHVARAAQAARDPAFVPPPPQLRIGGGNVALDLTHPRVARVEAGRVVFEVPVSSPRHDIPVDKLQVLVAVNPVAGLVENISVHVREAFRVKLIAKVKAGEMSMDFTVVDPRYGPVPTSLTGDLSGSVLFIPMSGNFTRTRTEWQRVKSFDERLSVKLGPLQFPDF